MLLPTSSISCVVHAGGIAELIQLREPSFYTSGISHKLFVGFRPVLVSRCFPPSMQATIDKYRRFFMLSQPVELPF